MKRGGEHEVSQETTTVVLEEVPASLVGADVVSLTFREFLARLGGASPEELEPTTGTSHSWRATSTRAPSRLEGSFGRCTKSFAAHTSTRNLKIERSLRKQSWHVTRIGRVEVADAAAKEDFEQFLEWGEVLDALPFRQNRGYPEQWPIGSVIPELESDFATSAGFADDIPF